MARMYKMTSFFRLKMQLNFLFVEFFNNPLSPFSLLSGNASARQQDASKKLCGSRFEEKFSCRIYKTFRC